MLCVCCQARSHIEPKIDGTQVTLAIAEPCNLTVEINDDWVHSLHLFANPIEANAPQPNDPHVIYFGPGIHEIKAGITVGSGQTLYLAGGAILHGVGSEGGPLSV